MGKKSVKNKRKVELRIIFFIILVAAALFIISTYAWFSTQKNVSITNLTGLVEVAEGLEISLDADKWSNEIVLGEDMNIIDNAYPNHRNISPKEMLPVSTLGLPSDDSPYDLQMIRGKVENTKMLKEIQAMDESLAGPEVVDHKTNAKKYPGYFAFDIFLKNMSKEENPDELQLNHDSSLQVIEPEKSFTGLQNTVRVAFARYGAVYDAGKSDYTGVSDTTAQQSTILEQTGASETGDDVPITDVAMWEPNSTDHVEYIVKYNNYVRWSAADEIKIFGLSQATDNQNTQFAATTKVPTYALKDTVLDVEDTVIKNLYNWDSADKTDDEDSIFSGHLAKQMTLQTSKSSEEDYTVGEGVQFLFSTSSKEGEEDSEANRFTLPPNKIVRLRIYVWLEGQDVDCINYASFGGGIHLNLGLVKGAGLGTHGESEEEE